MGWRERAESYLQLASAKSESDFYEICRAWSNLGNKERFRFYLAEAEKTSDSYWGWLLVEEHWRSCAMRGIDDDDHGDDARYCGEQAARCLREAERYAATPNDWLICAHRWEHWVWRDGRHALDLERCRRAPEQKKTAESSSRD